ncbi:Protein of unknown function [Bacillus cytotoxicus]|nr:Protein of unknown function [Bacillus cytotoxicus]
MAKLALY